MGLSCKLPTQYAHSLNASGVGGGRTDVAIAVRVRVCVRLRVAVALRRVHSARAGVPEQVREERRGVPAAREEEQESAADVDVRRGRGPRRQQDRCIDHAWELGESRIV